MRGSIEAVISGKFVTEVLEGELDAVRKELGIGDGLGDIGKELLHGRGILDEAMMIGA